MGPFLGKESIINLKTKRNQWCYGNKYSFVNIYIFKINHDFNNIYTILRSEYFCFNLMCIILYSLLS